MSEENNEDNSLQDADLELEEYLIKDDEVILQTHQRIHPEYSGKIQ